MRQCLAMCTAEFVHVHIDAHTRARMCKFTLLWRTLCAKMAAFQMECPSEALVL